MDVDISNDYEGREHSGIKHKLLEGYLEKLLLIRGMSGIREFAYVDCFAGPWGDESDDLHANSIAISLRILEGVREALAVRGKYVSMKAIYVEKTKKRYSRLESYLKSNCPKGVQATPIYGDYVDKIPDILLECHGTFAFFFVDPKQWTPVAVPRLSPLLTRENSEFIINFMYDFFRRAFPQVKEKLRASVRAMLGEISDEEIADICALDTEKKEQACVRKYRNFLKDSMPAQPNRRPRSYHATVLDVDRERTKYHLVYLTTHSKGIVEFAKLSEHVAIIQRKVRFEAKQARTGQIDMFGMDDATIEKLESAESEDVKRYWMSRLGTTARVYNENDLADMLEDTDWLVSDFERAFKELQLEGKVENMDAQRTRPVHPINFEKGERLRRCI